MAVDAAPYPVNWGDQGSLRQRQKAIARFYEFAGYVLAVADQQRLQLRWGGDWDMDGDFLDQRFDDLVHFELVWTSDLHEQSKGANVPAWGADR